MLRLTREGFFEHSRRILQRRRHHVRVGIHRQRDLRVTDELDKGTGTDGPIYLILYGHSCRAFGLLAVTSLTSLPFTAVLGA